MPPHPLTNFEIQRYYPKEHRFNGVYSRHNLPKIKDGTYVTNLDECKSIGTHFIANDVIYVDDVTCLDSFGVKHVSKEINNFTWNKSITTNIFRIQA